MKEKNFAHQIAVKKKGEKRIEVVAEAFSKSKSATVYITAELRKIARQEGVKKSMCFRFNMLPKSPKLLVRTTP